MASVPESSKTRTQDAPSVFSFDHHHGVPGVELARVAATLGAASQPSFVHPKWGQEGERR